MRITASTSIFPLPARGPVRRAGVNLLRDIARCCLPGDDTGTPILLRDESMPTEAYRIDFS